MEIISVILNSSILMGLFAFVFTVFGIRCLIYGVLGGTSTILRLLATALFVIVAYYCWKQAISINGSNVIDGFVLDAWRDLKHLIGSIKF